MTACFKTQPSIILLFFGFFFSTAEAGTFKSMTVGFWKASGCVMPGSWQSRDVPLLSPQWQADERDRLGLTYAGLEETRAPRWAPNCWCCTLLCSWKAVLWASRGRCAGYFSGCLWLSKAAYVRFRGPWWDQANSLQGPSKAGVDKCIAEQWPVL